MAGELFFLLEKVLLVTHTHSLTHEKKKHGRSWSSLAAAEPFDAGSRGRKRSLLSNQQQPTVNQRQARAKGGLELQMDQASRYSLLGRKKNTCTSNSVALSYRGVCCLPSSPTSLAVRSQQKARCPARIVRVARL